MGRMTRSSQVRREKLLGAAEGYLSLEMPEHALASLREVPDPEEARFAFHYLRGEALKVLARHAEALESLHQALEEKPDHVPLLLSLAWCYKRVDQLPKAIAAMEQAYRASPKDPLILYNLSCYWSLAGNKAQALSWLGRALRMDLSFRKLIAAEHDFDPLRDDEDFQSMLRALDDAAPSK